MNTEFLVSLENILRVGNDLRNKAYDVALQGKKDPEDVAIILEEAMRKLSE